MSFVVRRPADPQALTRRPRRRAASFVIAVLACLLTAPMVAASTPVTDGYRDQTYGGGAFRPTADKPQSKLWFTDGSWFAGMFLYKTTNPPKSEYRIYRLDRTTHSWVDTTTVLDTRDKTHGDYLWLEASQTLWVASSYLPTAGATDDGIKIFKYSYNAGTNKYTAAAGFPITIPNTATNPATPSVLGGAASVTLERDSTGRLWAVWAMGSQVRYSTSTDGLTWTTPAQVPTQAANSIRPAGDKGDLASVIAFGSNIGVAWSDHDDLPSNADNGYYFSVIAAGADPTVAGNWTLQKLPTLVASPGESADNHINMKTTSDGTVYLVGKTGKDTAGCSTNKNQPLIELFRRTPAGSWNVYLVGTVGDCDTRPQVAVSEQLGAVYVLVASPNGGGAIYLKSAPISGPDAFKFRGTADDSVQRGFPIIRSTTETLIDDVTSAKNPIGGTGDLVVMANNLTATGSPNQKFYLHAEVPLAYPDNAAPIGTLTLAGGAASTNTLSVSAAAPATDAGSGLSLVRLSNSGAVSGGVLTTGTSYSSPGPFTWSLAGGGDGPRTVYAQWRDGAGHWSAPVSDTIIYDSVALVGGVKIDDDAAFATKVGVSLDVAATDAGSGVDNVRIANVGSVDGNGILNGAGATTMAYSTPKAWNLSAGDGNKTVYVQWQDGNGIWSPVQSDSIVLDATDPAGTVSINGGAAKTGNSTVSVAVPVTDATSGVAQVRLANSPSTDGNGVLDGAGATTRSYATPQTWTLTAGDGPKTVYVQWKDTAGNWSAVASDSITMDASLPPFTDIEGNMFYEDIDWLFDSGITTGCTPTLFCPNDTVSRGQMAAFLHRALPDLPLGTPKEFIDDNGSMFEPDIEWLSAAGITQGCTPDRFCPDAPVTRGQMAAFLHRALPDLPLGTATDFTDTDGTTFEQDIAWLSAAGITQGCTPTTFCPNGLVTRGQMAAFLHRALGD